MEYQSKKNETSSYRATSLELGKDVDNDANEFLEFMAKKKKSRTTVMKTELDYYLEEDNLPVTQEFDILSWWKTNGLKF
ncbi:hAT transposon family protein, partial [Mycobacterium tuberculosis]|uniref:hAT transposon family protein n=1 Tax=Mycobacterium tuberculosis TaxID=1773 RepID=UPI002550DE52